MALTDRYLELRNSGGGQLKWTATTDNPYVTLHDETGRLVLAGTIRAGAVTKLHFVVSGRNADADTPLAATVNIVSNGGDRTIVISFGATASCRTSSSWSWAGTNAPLPVGNEILVSYRTAGTISGQALASFAAGVRLDLTATYGLTTLEAGYGAQPDLLRVPTGSDVDALVSRLAADPRVSSVQRNYYVGLQQVPPQDPYYRSQWALSSFGLEEAWGAIEGREARPVTIAVLDTGVDSEHPELAHKVLPGYDFFKNAPSADPLRLPRDSGSFNYVAHGTHVAGIATAAKDGNGMVGVAFGSGIRILPVKLFDDCGGGTLATLDALIKAIRWAAGLPVIGAPTNPFKADIINMSVGLPGQHPVLNETTLEAWNEDVLLIAAAGNHNNPATDHTGVLSPANGPHVIAVGSVDENRQRSAFSNFGPELDLMAPGGYGGAASDPEAICPAGQSPTIVSSVPYDSSDLRAQGFGCMAGTSMAAPFVAGVAALLLSQNDGMTPAEVRTKLQQSAYRGSGMEDANQYGHGLVCADAALGAATVCGAPAN